MRIATGVILIVAAVLNLLASLGYLAGGAVTGGLTEMGAQMEQAAQQDREMSEEDKAAAEAAKEMFSAASSYGPLLLAFGVFLLISVGILIAGAVFLFQGKKPGFIIGAGVVAIAAEVIGILITAFGVTNLVGIIGGVLAFISAKMMGSGASSEATV